jgi:hypothetical protein
LKEIAVHEKAYKIILDCSDDVVPFYEKVIEVIVGLNSYRSGSLLEGIA